jgi:GTP diphosphokinase / guanosine-3',5'-bis(diphosphate) 3'-diphosphatase
METIKIFLPDYILREYRKLIRLARNYSVDINIDILRTAFVMANEACKRQYQKGTEPLIIQSLQVAQIVVSEIGLGAASIASAMLYKFVESGSIEVPEIEKKLGAKIAVLTYELANIASIDIANTAGQAENFRKLLLTSTSDVRVIIIKLADRLYVLRNLDIEETGIQQHIAHEAFDLYAPLGHRLGLYPVKSEMEDLSMKYTNREMYNFIFQKLQETAAKRNRFIKNFIAPIKTELENHKYNFEIKSRTKSVFSIWNKMRKLNLDFEEVYDLFAIRIILESDLKHEKEACWRIFSLVTNLYKPHPERMRDWITVPKASGYEALHITVDSAERRMVEIQIRTRRMDEIAEKGLAAHWKYKGQKGDTGLDNWLNKIRDMLDTPDNEKGKLIDNIELDLHSQEIFILTPIGDIKQLPKGATVLDFAYDIHSSMGNSCVGARVNGKNVPIRYELNNGDKVEITTSKNQKPKTDWLDFVITSKAKAKIKLSLKEEKLLEADNGKEIFKRRIRNWKIPFNDLLVSNLLKYYKLKTSIDFYAMIAKEEIDMADVKKTIALFNKHESQVTDKIGDVPIEKIVKSLADKPEEILVIDEKILNNLDYKLARCCNPIFGDDVFGFVTISDGIKIHRLHCPNAGQLINRFGYRVLKARWAGKDSLTYFHSTIKLTGIDEIGILSKISDVIAKDLRVNLRSINVDTGEGQFEGLIKLFVKEAGHLDALIHKLLKIKGIHSAQRVDGM